MGEPVWKAFVGGQKLGPVDEETILQWVREKKVGAKTQVWKKGMAAWVKAGEVELFQSALAEPVAAPPEAAAAPVAEVAPVAAAEPVAAASVAPMVAAAPVVESLQVVVPGGDGSLPDEFAATVVQPSPFAHLEEQPAIGPLIVPTPGADLSGDAGEKATVLSEGVSAAQVEARQAELAAQEAATALAPVPDMAAAQPPVAFEAAAPSGDVAAAEAATMAAVPSHPGPDAQVAAAPAPAPVKPAGRATSVSLPKIPILLLVFGLITLAAHALGGIGLLQGSPPPLLLVLVIGLWVGDLLMVLGPITYSGIGKLLGMLGSVVVLGALLTFGFLTDLTGFFLGPLALVQVRVFEGLLAIVYVYFGLLMPLLTFVYLAASGKFKLYVRQK